MRVTVTNNERFYDAGSGKCETLDMVVGSFNLSGKQELAMKRLSKQYRTNVAGMVEIALAYYFADGKDHLTCEQCGWLLDGYGEEPGRCLHPDSIDCQLFELGKENEK